MSFLINDNITVVKVKTTTHGVFWFVRELVLAACDKCHVIIGPLIFFFKQKSHMMLGVELHAGF